MDQQKRTAAKKNFNGRMIIAPASVSENVVGKMWEYIKNQEVHYKAKSFDDEFENFLKRAGFQRFKD